MKIPLAISILGLAAATFQTASPAAARQDQSDELRSNLLLTESASQPPRTAKCSESPTRAMRASLAVRPSTAVSRKPAAPARPLLSPMSWDVVVMTCSRRGQSSLPIVAGSGENAALEVAFKKAVAASVDPRSCSQVYSY
jgi:hypothetical protein